MDRTQATPTAGPMAPSATATAVPEPTKEWPVRTSAAWATEPAFHLTAPLNTMAWCGLGTHGLQPAQKVLP